VKYGTRLAEARRSLIEYPAYIETGIRINLRYFPIQFREPVNTWRAMPFQQRPGSWPPWAWEWQHPSRSQPFDGFFQSRRWLDAGDHMRSDPAIAAENVNRAKKRLDPIFMAYRP
jgi:hypothetical protein